MSAEDLRALAAYDQARHSEREDIQRCRACRKEIFIGAYCSFQCERTQWRKFH